VDTNDADRGPKAGGILCESSLLEDRARVHGIGINVEPASGMGPERATTEHGSQDGPVLGPTSPGPRPIWRRFHTCVVETGALSVPKAGTSHGETGRRVTLLDVNPEGHLVVRDEGGAIRSLLSGEVRRVRVTPS
jgi:biotin-(acetyl-CoA carboxylase) ligase